MKGGKKSPEKKQIIYKSFNNLPINRIDDEENKLDYLSHLTTPKILLMKNNNKLVPYIFKLVPTEFCYTYAVEHYNLEFVNISNEQDVYLYKIRKELLIYCSLVIVHCLQTIHLKLP